MKFTLSWLKEHLETDKPLEDLLDTLTLIGLEVEEVFDPAAARSEFFVRVCGWWRRVELEGDRLALEDAEETRDLLAREPVPDITDRKSVA